MDRKVLGLKLAEVHKVVAAYEERINSLKASLEVEEILDTERNPQRLESAVLKEVILIGMVTDASSLIAAEIKNQREAMEPGWMASLLALGRSFESRIHALPSSGNTAVNRGNYSEIQTITREVLEFLNTALIPYKLFRQTLIDQLAASKSDIPQLTPKRMERKKRDEVIRQLKKTYPKQSNANIAKMAAEHASLAGSSSKITKDIVREALRRSTLGKKRRKIPGQ